MYVSESPGLIAPRGISGLGSNGCWAVTYLTTTNSAISLGSTLARRQIQIALRTLLRRLPDYVIDHERLVRAETIGVTYGTFAMPITFAPGPRVLS